MLNEHLNEDCGSTDYFSIYIKNEKVFKNVLGANVVNKDGTYRPIVASDKSNMIDKIITIRTPLGCRHTDKVCKACLGDFYYSLNRHNSVGFDAVTTETKNKSQGVFSTKQ